MPVSSGIWGQDASAPSSRLLQRGRLLLVELQSPESGAPLMRRRPPRTLSLDSLFPCHDGPVWAQWFTGRLRCPMGLPLSLDDSIDETIYERDMLVDVEAGRVQRIAFRHNEAEPLHTLVDEMKGLGGPLAPSALAAARAAMRFAANLRQ